MDVFEFRERGTSDVDAGTEDLAHAVIGAAIEVHRELGPGMPEHSYRDAMAHEFELRGIPYEREVPIDIVYKGKKVGCGRIDLLVGDRLIIELKAIETIAPVHKAQVLTYLKITKLQLGLLINFNVPVLKQGLHRIVNT